MMLLVLTAITFSPDPVYSFLKNEFEKHQYMLLILDADGIVYKRTTSASGYRNKHGLNFTVPKKRLSPAINFPFVIHSNSTPSSVTASPIRIPLLLYSYFFHRIFFVAVANQNPHNPPLLSLERSSSTGSTPPDVMALSFTVAPYLALRFDELVRSRRQPDENLVFRLLHFEEAYKPLKVGILIRLELLMRDEIITSCICKRLLFMDSLTKGGVAAYLDVKKDGGAKNQIHLYVSDGVSVVPGVVTLVLALRVDVLGGVLGEVLGDVPSENWRLKCRLRSSLVQG
ncbi:hypothetical protein DY000_02029720 [Brassica cretica]|uniref:Uncharacterized protein n=1 Tax=Brassica cretica TaxID=69181 RepID=A0ABQ7DT68_BRACR|nr:hypothetical protein DY000_02029720 [Brassica cretica]